MHVPGLKVIMPSIPYDAKGLLLASIADSDPTIFIEHRWIYDNAGYVPEQAYTVPIGKAAIRREGKDVTVVAVSYAALEALEAANKLSKEGIDVEVVDLRSLKPLDENAIVDSVKKTGRLVVVDTGWRTCGVGSEVSAVAATDAFAYLKAPIVRVTTADVPTPAGSALEKAFYPGIEDIILAVKQAMGDRRET